MRHTLALLSCLLLPAAGHAASVFEELDFLLSSALECAETLPPETQASFVAELSAEPVNEADPFDALVDLVAVASRYCDLQVTPAR